VNPATLGGMPAGAPMMTSRAAVAFVENRTG
jgi:hypothetical protein